MDKRAILERIFHAGVAACLPERVLPHHLPEPSAGRTFLLAIGKGAAAMARVVEGRWRGPLLGLAVVPRGAEERLPRIACLGAGHPIPDEASVAAARRLLALASQAGPDDLVLVLLSGGASSLACLPAPGVTLTEKQHFTAALLRSGAPIEAVNCVRRHLSGIKGGRLGAAAQPARLITLAVSDVVGDRPEDIGSGPTVPDPTGIADAEAVLVKYGIEPPSAEWSESVKSATGWCADYRIVARNADALSAAATEAKRQGYESVVNTHVGEARVAAQDDARTALDLRHSGSRMALISGGELTVTIQGTGTGGPNREYALALAHALQGGAGISVLAADTDGIDGTGDAAGAFIDPTTLARARALGLDATRALRDNDSGPFFAALGDQFVTGSSGINVNDLRIVLVDRTV